jgi:hypothetical protein
VESSDEEEMGAFKDLIDTSKEKKKALREIGNRTIFHYDYWSWFRINRWYLKCCYKEKRNDRLWKDASAKLNKEIDVIEIIKSLRILKCIMTAQMTRQQREMVKFF